MPRRIAKRARPLRVPEAHAGIQVNFCRNPTCRNFGVVPSQESQQGKHGRGGVRTDFYKVVGGRTSKAMLVCAICGETYLLRSNRAVAEEFERMTRFLEPNPGPACPREGCINGAIPVKAHADCYYSYGRTKSGSTRYQCKACGKTFSIAAHSTLRQKRPEVNEQVFKLLMNKSPLRRICEVVGIHPVTLYSKIDFIYRQTELFTSSQESRLLRDIDLGTMYLSIDRQDHLTNWGTQLDRRNVVLHAIATADDTTGFVMGMHLDYDPEVDIREAELDAMETGDKELDYAFRRYARIVLPGDGDDAFHQYVRKLKGAPDPRASVHLALDEDAAPDDSEKLPPHGAKIHSGYTMAGHFHFLSHLLSRAEKIRLFMDQDTGMRAASLAAFCEPIRQRRVDAFLVKINKDLTVDQKRSRLSQGKLALEKVRARHPGLAPRDLVRELMKERLSRLDRQAKWSERWVPHPAPDMGEPEKSVCYLTDFGDYDPDHLANLYLKASLRAIDRYFMQVRRRVMMLERPIATASSFGRTWHGYSAYDPAVAAKLMLAFRVYYNYCLRGEDKRTPAMRLGLAAQPVTVSEILAMR